MRLNSKQIAEFTGATVIVEALDPSQLALGITWDSRDVQEDFVYVALPGARVDGHDFIDEALRKGAHIDPEIRLPVLLVVRSSTGKRNT